MRFENVELHNVQDTANREDGPGVRTCRLPLEILPEINNGAAMRSWAGAGCEIRGMLPPGGKARIVLERTNENVIPAIAETYFGCFFDAFFVIDDGPVEITIEEPPRMALMTAIAEKEGLPFATNLVRINLPHLHDVCIHAIEGDLTYPTEDATPALTLLTYGSSITHGAHALRPSGTYASQAARHLGCNLVNLGVGGSAQMDAAIAEHIAARNDWDVAWFEMGINVGQWDLAKFREVVSHFVGTIADAQPEKPIFCMDVFTFGRDYDDTWEHNGAAFRDIVREIVEKQQSNRAFYVDGRTILTDPTGLRPDLVHPCDDGMHEMGHHLAETIKASGAVAALMPE